MDRVGVIWCLKTCKILTFDLKISGLYAAGKNLLENLFNISAVIK